MTLREKQSLFLFNVSRLIAWSQGQGFDLTGGELWRTDEQQAIYLRNGKSKAPRSKHQDRLAIDLNLFIGGVYKTDSESYKPLAEFWESLHPDNRAGYRWGWDANHFQFGV